MAVFRINKTSNYTIMSNYHLKEKEMSLKAKGLLSLMLSLPDNWDYSLNGLVAICKENESAIKTTLQELKDFGYLEINKKYPNSTDTGRIEYEYMIYEMPKQEGEKQGVENQPLEILPLEIQPLENHTQLNTNILNTKESITKELNTKERVCFKKPSLSEIEDYINEKSLNVNAKSFYDYFEAGNWIDSKGNKVKSWKQKLLTWNNHTRKDERTTNNPFIEIMMEGKT
jgi:hypothetical protein